MNRGVEIDSAVADGARSVILPQVTFGIAVRMAVMSIIAELAMAISVRRLRRRPAQSMARTRQVLAVEST